MLGESLYINIYAVIVAQLQCQYVSIVKNFFFEKEIK